MMNSPNEDGKQPDNMELPKPQATACGTGCGCHTPGALGKTRWVIGAIVLVAAGALVARAVIKNNGAATDAASAGFAALTAPGQAPALDGAVTPPDALGVKEIGTFSELNAIAANMAGVFVFLPGKSETTAKAPTAQIRAAVRTIESQVRGKIGIFTLKAGSRDYEQVAAQMAGPGVLAIVKGRGMSAISGDITETKLVQGFVAASRAGGCGPTSGGCGPSGCN
ncbi:MAG: hypothetical protein HY360_07780 [Verrucomicrobia bacterium]|nr:hypothetical protein [Verrucomicrobiota bacterium]